MLKGFYFFLKQKLSLWTLLFLFTVALIAGCSESNHIGNSVALTNDSISVSDSIIDSDGVMVTVKNVVVFPNKLGDDAQKSQKLRELFNTRFFEKPINDKQALVQLISISIKNTLATYSSHNSSPETDLTERDETEIVNRYDIITYIRPFFHGSDFISYRKDVTTRKDNKETMCTSSFATFDLKTMKPLTITDIFADNTNQKINELLRQELCKKEKCNSSDQLVELGYFNIDNLSITNNFYLSDSGIVFHYNPLEVACYAIGEVDVLLSYDSIQNYVLETSPIVRLIP